MRFEGKTSKNPRIPKSLLIDNGKPIGPFAIRDNAVELAKKTRKKHIKVPTGYGWAYYVIPHNMDENFNTK